MTRTHTLQKLIAVIALTSGRLMAEEGSRIVISIPDRKLVLLEGERVIRVYDVAVGKPITPTPAGEFEIVTRLKHPTWFYHGRVVPPGPANPLGTRWLGLSVAGYGIHGTNVPNSIGQAASHGCIRMRNRDVEELFTLVTVGTKVELICKPCDRVAKLLSAD